jgi:hypothetical protein
VQTDISGQKDPSIITSFIDKLVSVAPVHDGRVKAVPEHLRIRNYLDVANGDAYFELDDESDSDSEPEYGSEYAFPESGRQTPSELSEASMDSYEDSIFDPDELSSRLSDTTVGITIPAVRRDEAPKTGELKQSVNSDCITQNQGF